MPEDYEERIRRLAAERRARDAGEALRVRQQREAEEVRRLQAERWAQNFVNRCIPLIEAASAKSQVAGAGLFRLSRAATRRSEQRPSIGYILHLAEPEAPSSPSPGFRGALPLAPKPVMSIVFASTQEGMVEISLVDESPEFVAIGQFQEQDAGKAFAAVIERALGLPEIERLNPALGI